MKRILAAMASALLILGICTVSLALPDGVEDVADWEGVTLEEVWLRAEPIMDISEDEAVEKLRSGETVTVTGTYGETFCYVSFDGKEGFAKTEDIGRKGDTIAAPVYSQSSKTWGHVRVPDTVIDYDITNNSSRYHTSYDYIFTFQSDLDSPVYVIFGHNMRNRAGQADSMFHELHHVQNKYLGVEKCEKCGAECESAGTDIQIQYGKYSDWELVCFYETETSEPYSTLVHNSLYKGQPRDGEEKQEWIDYQLERAANNEKGMVLSGARASDKIMIFVNCGDMKGGSTGARLYMVFKSTGR